MQAKRIHQKAEGRRLNANTEWISFDEKEGIICRMPSFSAFYIFVSFQISISLQRNTIGESWFVNEAILDF
jgi:hypothetical protein